MVVLLEVMDLGVLMICVVSLRGEVVERCSYLLLLVFVVFCVVVCLVVVARGRPVVRSSLAR